CMRLGRCDPYCAIGRYGVGGRLGGRVSCGCLGCCVRVPGCWWVYALWLHGALPVFVGRCTELDVRRALENELRIVAVERDARRMVRRAHNGALVPYGARVRAGDGGGDGVVAGGAGVDGGGIDDDLRGEVPVPGVSAV